jgi:hypothetical protein
MAGFNPAQAQAPEGGSDQQGYAPPPQEPAEQPQQPGQQPGQLQYPYAQGQVIPAQGMQPEPQGMQPQPGQQNAMGFSGGIVNPQTGSRQDSPPPGSQQFGQPQQPGGFAPQPGFQPAQPDPNAAQGSPSGPYVNQQQQFGQQPINPVTPYASQPSLQPGVSGQAGQNPGTNPIDMINQQLRGSTRVQGGFGNAGPQTIGGGLAGVASKAESEGIKIYRKHTKYNEWEFIYDQREDMSNPNAVMTGGGVQSGGVQTGFGPGGQGGARIPGPTK